MNRSNAEILREYGILPGADQVHGVTYDGRDVWIAAGDMELRRIDPRTGEVLERLEMPRGAGVSGLGFDGDQFFCGGGKSGKVRAVRRPGR